MKSATVVEFDYESWEPSLETSVCHSQLNRLGLRISELQDALEQSSHGLCGALLAEILCDLEKTRDEVEGLTPVTASERKTAARRVEEAFNKYYGVGRKRVNQGKGKKVRA